MALSSCSHVEEAPVSTEIIIEKLLNDPLAEQYFLAIHDIGNIGTEMKKEVMISSYKFSEIESLNDFKKFIEQNYNQPEDVYASFLQYSSLTMNIREKYPELITMEEEKLADIVNHFYNFSLGLEKNMRVQDQCTEQLRSSLDSCRHLATMGAVLCGLEAPTVIGVVICGASVLTGLEICNDAAWDSFEICIKYN